MFTFVSLWIEWGDNGPGTISWWWRHWFGG